MSTSLGKKLLELLRTFSKKKDHDKNVNIVANEKKYVTLGLDFGTSTTKCIINIEEHGSRSDTYHAFCFDSPDSKYGSLTYPTSLVCFEGKLFFGYEADKFSEQQVIRSFKMAIPCKNSWGDYISSLCIPEKPGYFRIENVVLSSVDLSTIYLSAVIAQVRSRLKMIIPDKKVEIYLNMACPLDQLHRDYELSKDSSEKQAADIHNRYRDEYIEQSYKHMSRNALMLSLYAHNPWDLNNAIEALNMVKNFSIGKEEGRTCIVPETLAAISAYIQRPGVEYGRYITIDVGAGTTDIAVFWLQKNHSKGEVKPFYYSSGSLHLGIDHFDRALQKVTASYEGISIRQRRESLIKIDGGLSGYIEYVQEYLNRMIEHRFRCFGRGYDKEKKLLLWGDSKEAKLKMLLVGGGSRIDVVKRTLVNNQIWPAVLGYAEYDVPDLEKCEKALLPNGNVVNLRDEKVFNSTHILLLAEGLASRSIDIPEYGIEHHKRDYKRKILEYEDLGFNAPEYTIRDHTSK